MNDQLKYCASFYKFQRRSTREVMVGKVGVGGDNPIRVQSMLTSDTLDTDACVKETLGLVEVGCEIVRITAQTRRHAANLEHIKSALLAKGCDVPIVADIHFKPDAALEAAKWVEKVRVNPGNYTDSKKFAVREYSDDEYAEEIERIREDFSPLVDLCKKRGVAMRIGTNHGSLSDRIMNRYGDTPLGMVESALEFARIAREMDYHAFIFSMKASNPKVMIEAYRLLVARLAELGADWNYPIHLGVTEAGDGEDGRIKSAIGIGSLLGDGVGDTVRVSLTEDSVYEIPVAFALVRCQEEKARQAADISEDGVSYDPFDYVRRSSEEMEIGGVKLGGEQTVRVFTSRKKYDQLSHKLDKLGDFKPEIVVEESGVVEIDPRDDTAIALVNESDNPQLVTVADDVDLPVVAAFRLLAKKVDARHPVLLKDVLKSSRGVPPLLVVAASRRDDQIRDDAKNRTFFDPEKEVNVQRGDALPHWDQEGGTYAITFRLEDSLPQAVIDAYCDERSKLKDLILRENENLKTLSGDEARAAAKRLVEYRGKRAGLKSSMIDPELDRGYGDCWLGNNREIAKIVADAVRFFDGERYELIAWCVMSNHVHMVIRPFDGHSRGDILQSIKSFTAKKANAILGGEGAFWQKESYDHLVRDEEDFFNQVSYVLGNPEAAGLLEWEWMGSVYDAARRRDNVPRRDASATFLNTLLTAASNMGSLICDGIGDAILIQGEEAPGQSMRLSYNVLQAAGARIFKTDYVACPSCGRTLFNLQETTAKIRVATGHLKGVRIAIMGCIVNGPGEMADADFGYVGGAPSKINLYVGKQPVKFNIPQAEAVDRLIDLIREHGKWVDAPAQVVEV